MTVELTGEAWAQIRHDYEHTDRPVEEICAEHGISSGTLRNRMRRWRWTRRHPPIPFEGPPPAPAPQIDLAAPPPPAAGKPDIEAPSLAASPPGETAALAPLPSPHLADYNDADAPRQDDDNAIVLRLQSAVARVLPAIEATVAMLAAGPQHLRELERSARLLAALTRTLRELNSLLSQRQAAAAAGAAHDYKPRNMEELRRELERKIMAAIESENDRVDDAAAAREAGTTASRSG